jgi:hypothetical protein
MMRCAHLLLCIASLLPAMAMAEDEDVRFGRLFTEPKTRENLDESRKQNTSEELPVAEEMEEDVAVTTLKMNGVIMRRDGSAEVWINGVRSDSSRQTIRRSGGNRFQVALPGGGEVTLKPGQVYSLESRSVIEGYEAEKLLAAERKVEAQAADEAASATEPTSAKPAPAKDPSAGFDESELAKQDIGIKLEQESGKE